jgi:tRNA-2-methylthio-N6-dimethylallyladenosine synthase
MNERDSEKMAGLLVQMGFEAADSQETADFVLYNTCCVRESAEDRVLGHLSRLKRIKADKPGLIVAVGGCMTQQSEMAKLLREKHKYVNLIFGTANRHRLPEFLWRVMENNERVIDISECDEIPEITDIPVITREFPHKAGVNIMYGCDNFCSYCIVPYVRGREKSRPPKDILYEVTALAKDGVKEIMLLGQNVNSYAGDFPKLLRDVNAVNGLERIRFMTSHPKDFSDELIAAIRDLPKVCKSVHLPLQAGSTRILADMNRQYSKEYYIALAEKLSAVPELALTTDIIVGYPGETEEDFQDTLDIVRRVRFAGAFTFIYSKRSGTPAAERTDLVPRKTANERFDRLTAELYPIMTEKNTAKIGQVLAVMTDGGADSYKGRADDHTLVHFTAARKLNAGDIVPVRITAAKTFYISGVMI